MGVVDDGDFSIADDAGKLVGRHAGIAVDGDFGIIRPPQPACYRGKGIVGIDKNRSQGLHLLHGATPTGSGAIPSFPDYTDSSGGVPGEIYSVYGSESPA
jgi:hypothetical protein